jgi:RNA polymerase sigma-70 factor (ECF subfamily)
MLTTSPSLLERLRQPEDRDSWERFIQLYTPLLYSWACQLGVRDAEDAVQDVFVILVQEMPRFQYDSGKSFRALLKTILMNLLRKRFRRPALGALPADVPGPEPDAAEVFESTEYRQRLVARALELMQTDFQESTWKSFWECEVCGRPAAEVAQDLGLTIAAVYMNKSRVLARLRQELAGLWH